MHSTIFQITKEQVFGNNLLNEDTISQGDGTPYDYCSEIDDGEHQRSIETLVNEILPKGMFEVSVSAIPSCQQ